VEKTARFSGPISRVFKICQPLIAHLDLERLERQKVRILIVQHKSMDFYSWRNPKHVWKLLLNLILLKMIHFICLEIVLKILHFFFS